MILFFQNPSVPLILLALPQILRAREVIFYRPYWLANAWVNPRRLHWAKKLIRWVNPRAEVAEHDPEEAFPLAYENNLASDQAMEEFFPHVSGAASFAVLSALIEDPHMDRFYKMRLLPRVLYETQFYRTARHWRDSGKEIRIVPGSLDRYGFHRAFFGKGEFRHRIPPAVLGWLQIKDRLGRGLNRLLGINLFLLLGPPLYFLLETAGRAGIRRRAVPIRTDVVMPLIWGVNEEGMCRGMKTGMDNFYLLGGELSSSRVAFYFSDWAFTPEERRLEEERMARRGIRYFDPKRFPLTLKFLREAAGRYGQLLKRALRQPGLLAEDRGIARVSSSLFYNFLKGRLFMTWVDYKVFLERQDYSAAHVVRTLLSEKMGRLTVGDHHGAPDGPTGFPVIRYTHIHRHAVWGEAFLRAFEPHWDPMQNVLVGSWRSDFVKAAQQPERLQELRERFRRLYGARGPLVVMLFPTLGGHQDLRRIREAMEGLRLLRAEAPGDFTVVCRFRSVELAARTRALGLEAVLQQDSRITLDLGHFTTYEWFALSDGVISATTSTGLIEAAAAGKPAFTFDYRFLAEKVFPQYGRDLVLRNRQDLVRVFRGMASGFRGFDCHWERLARDFSRYSDGGCIQRYRQMILRAVQDVEMKNGSMEPSLEQAVEQEAVQHA